MYEYDPAFYEGIEHQSNNAYGAIAAGLLLGGVMALAVHFSEEQESIEQPTPTPIVTQTPETPYE